MAYLTGSFGGTDTFEDVKSLLHTFATTAGWTTNFNTYPYFHLSKGDILVNLYFNESPTVNNSGSGGTTTDPDYTIYGHLSVAPFTTNGSNAVQFLNQPESVVNGGSLSSSGFVLSNDWTGPYSTYWFFSGADGDSDYIHMVVRKANGHFCMLSFGQLDQKGAGYTGGGFLHGTYWHWWFDGTAPSFFNSGQGSDAYSNNHRWIGKAQGNYNIWVGSDQDATHPMIAHDAGGFGVPYTDGIFTLTNLGARNGTGGALEDMDWDNFRWLGMIFLLGPNPVNGVTPLFEIPIVKSVAADSRGYYLGSIPGMQWGSMINRLESETLSFGSDNWVMFPFKRLYPWFPEPYSTFSVTSGPYGYACKINT